MEIVKKLSYREWLQTQDDKKVQGIYNYYASKFHGKYDETSYAGRGRFWADMGFCHQDANKFKYAQVTEEVIDRDLELCKEDIKKHFPHAC